MHKLQSQSIESVKLTTMHFKALARLLQSTDQDAISACKLFQKWKYFTVTDSGTGTRLVELKVPEAIGDARVELAHAMTSSNT